VAGGEELSPPPYAETVDVRSSEGASDEEEESVVSQDDDSQGAVGEESELQTGDESGGEDLSGSGYSSWHPAHRP
jgi:hypothetical protein